MRSIEERFNELRSLSNIASSNGEVLVQISVDLTNKLIFMSNSKNTEYLTNILYNLFLMSFRDQNPFGDVIEAFTKASMAAVEFLGNFNESEIAKKNRYENFKQGNIDNISDSELDEFIDRSLKDKESNQNPELIITYLEDRIKISSKIRPLAIQAGIFIKCDSFKFYKNANDYYLEFENTQTNRKQLELYCDSMKDNCKIIKKGCQILDI